MWCLLGYSYWYREGRGKLNLKKFDPMKVFSQEKICLQLRQIPLAGNLGSSWKGCQGAPSAGAAPCSGQDVQLNWAEPWDRSDKGCASLTDPGTATLPNTKLTFTSHIFCSLILSSGSFQPREISLQVPALNSLSTVTLSVFPELWKSQRISCKAPSSQMGMSGLIWRESRNSAKEIPGTVVMGIWKRQTTRPKSPVEIVMLNEVRIYWEDP